MLVTQPYECKSNCLVVSNSGHCKKNYYYYKSVEIEKEIVKQRINV